MNANTPTSNIWSLDITIDGYTPICWSIRHDWSMSITVDVEFFDRNTMSGFYQNPTTNPTLAHIYIVYRKS